MKKHKHKWQYGETIVGHSGYYVSFYCECGATKTFNHDKGRVEIKEWSDYLRMVMEK